MVGIDEIRTGITAFFATIAGVHHEIVNEWNVGNDTIIELKVTYDRKDGQQVTIPCVTILHTDAAGKIDAYRVYFDCTAAHAIGRPDDTHRTAPEHERRPSAMNTSMRSRYRLADKAVWRVGYGAMQLAGDGVFGPPRDRDEAIAVLRAAVDAGVDHIDTAQYYGPGVVNELIRDALHPYPDGLALVSKVAARRDDSGAVLPYDEPDQLRAGIHDNLTTLGVERLTAVNLRVMDNAAPDARFVDQLGALMTARDEGLIGGIGISNVSRDHLMRALEVTEIVCVQNFFNLAARQRHAHLGRVQCAGDRVRAVLSLGLSAGAARGDPDQPGRHRRRRWPRCERCSGRPRVVAGHRAERAADSGNTHSRSPR